MLDAMTTLAGALPLERVQPRAVQSCSGTTRRTRGLTRSVIALIVARLLRHHRAVQTSRVLCDWW